MLLVLNVRHIRGGSILGLNGFDCVRRDGGSVSVQARDHRKRRSNQLSADKNQRDYALAA